MSYGWGWEISRDAKAYPCHECGAVVIDNDYYSTNQVKHEEWHQRMRKADDVG